MKKIFSIAMLICLLCGCEAVFVPDISDQTITLISPTNQAILQEGINALHWESIEDATTYHVQIATPSFVDATQIIFDTLIENTAVDVLLQRGNYQWRVLASNSDYQTAYAISAFVVE